MMKNRPKRTPLNLILIVGGILLAVHMSTFLFAPDPEKDAWGQIIVPAEGDRMSDPVTVVGETRDIASGQFIWLVSRESKAAACLPIKRVLRNTRFRASFPVADRHGPLTLSIYVVDQVRHEQWQGQIGHYPASASDCPPDTRRLDTVRLIP